MPHSITDDLTPIRRRQEIAAILGRGVLRVCSACTVAPEARDFASESYYQKALDVPAPGDPHVSWLAEPRT